MAGLPWIPLSVDFPDSRKAVALGVALQNPMAWAYIVRLWTWAAKNAQDGRIEGPDSVAVIEHAAGWNGSPGSLVEAASLPHIALLDVIDRGFAVHDWADHCGAHVEKREKDRARMRRSRKANRSRTVREPSAHVPGEREREIEKERETEKTLEAPPPARAREAGSADRVAVLHGRDETLATKYPKTAALIAACARLGEPAAWAKDAPTRASAEAGVGAQDIEAVAARVVESIRETGKPWLGMHLAAIRGVSAAGPPGRQRAPDPRAAAAPSPPESFHVNDAAPWDLP